MAKERNFVHGKVDENGNVGIPGCVRKWYWWSFC